MTELGFEPKQIISRCYKFNCYTIQFLLFKKVGGALSKRGAQLLLGFKVSKWDFYSIIQITIGITGGKEVKVEKLRKDNVKVNRMKNELWCGERQGTEQPYKE